MTTGGRRRIGRPPRFFPAGTDPRSLAPMEIGLARRFAPGVGLRRRGRRFQPAEAGCLSRRLKSAFMGAFAPHVGLRRHEMLSGRRRPAMGRRPFEVEFIRRPPRRASTSAPMEIGLVRRFAPGVGLRRREMLSGRRRPAIGRRPFEVEFIRRPPRRASTSAPMEIGLVRRFAPGVGLRRHEMLSGRRRPAIGRRPLRSNSFDALRAGHRPLTPIEIGLHGRFAPGVGLRRREKAFRPAQAGHWPKAFEVEFVRLQRGSPHHTSRSGRPSVFQSSVSEDTKYLPL